MEGEWDLRRCLDCLETRDVVGMKKARWRRRPTMSTTSHSGLSARISCSDVILKTVTTSSNPFSRLHGVRDPQFYAPRNAFKEHVDVIFAELAKLNYVRGLRLIGVRGGGKTTELLRLGHAARRQGWLPINVTVRPTGTRHDPWDQLLTEVGKSLSNEILDRGGRDPLYEGRRKGTWTATGKLPVFELQYEHKPVDRAFDKFAAIRQAVNVHLENATPVVLLMDEADFLSTDMFEDFVVPLAHTAAVDNLPFTFITAGTTVTYLSAMNGMSTFGDALALPVELERLDETGAISLLVETAALGHQDWGHAEPLAELFEATRGVPRELQVAGASAFNAAPSIGVDEALREAASALASHRKGLLGMDGRLTRRQLAAGIQEILASQSLTLWELEQALRESLDVEFTYDELVNHVGSLQSAGVLEAHADASLECF